MKLTDSFCANVQLVRYENEYPLRYNVNRNWSDYFDYFILYIFPNCLVTGAKFFRDLEKELGWIIFTSCSLIRLLLILAVSVGYCLTGWLGTAVVRAYGRDWLCYGLTGIAACWYVTFGRFVKDFPKAYQHDTNVRHVKRFYIFSLLYAMFFCTFLYPPR